MASVANWLVKRWYAEQLGWASVFAPLSALFALMSAGRRLAYRLRWLPSYRLTVPVVVVGNVTVGGAGKTPLTYHLLTALRQQGWQPAVISRGYGGHATVPTPVKIDSDPNLCGDEPVLLARTGCPVWVGRDRVATGQALLAAHPEVDVLLSDDGLQHYRLQRDLELLVIDGRRQLGNGWLLPCGPLREGRWRLQTVDAVVVNGEPVAAIQTPAPLFAMTLQPEPFYALTNAAHQRVVADFIGKDCAAIAGIADPQRFFNTLGQMGLHCREYPFPDHHPLKMKDLPVAECVLMTEKDAVKLQQHSESANADDKLWVLPISAVLSPDLASWLTEQLKALHHHG